VSRSTKLFLEIAQSHFEYDGYSQFLVFQKKKFATSTSTLGLLLPPVPQGKKGEKKKKPLAGEGLVKVSNTRQHW
jgi:hypothetical protein